MTLLLLCLTVIYLFLSVVIISNARSMEYNFLVSTMLGLLFPAVLFSEGIITVILFIINFLHSKFAALILILCGTDMNEFQTKMLERILSVENDE